MDTFYLYILLLITQVAQGQRTCLPVQETQVSSPGLGRSPGEENGYPLRFSCLGNTMDRGACRAIVHRIARVRHNLMTKQQQLLTTAGYSTVQFSSVAQWCLTLYDPIDCSSPGFPVHHQHPELTQTHVH